MRVLGFADEGAKEREEVEEGGRLRFHGLGHWVH